ncbi:MAG: CpsD/CapB family tyrosine-protein kinase [Acidobacteriota bacterium]
MSRIDEALRRAAEGQASHTGSTPEPVGGSDVEELAQEPFPIEIAGRLRKRSHTAAGARSPEDRTPPAPDTPEPSPLRERIDSRLEEKVVADNKMERVPREQYRRLAAMLHDAQSNSGLSVIMIASSVPGEGKTLTAANLALTLSESYLNRVLLIDADLRKPALHQVFQLETATGLLDGLQHGEADVKLVLRSVSPTLWILPAGRPTEDPMAALTSDRMRQLLNEAKEAFDWVIIDTPPLLMLPDAHLLASMVDGAILLVKAGSTPHALVKRAADIIGRNRITGVVLNQADAHLQAGYGRKYYDRYPYGLRPIQGPERP